MDADEATDVMLVGVDEPAVQNHQELAAVWGNIPGDVRRLSGSLEASDCLLGRYDYLTVFEVPDGETALQMSVAMERDGLDVETLEGMPIDRFGELVEVV